MTEKNLGHDYIPTTGIPSFIPLAKKFMFGESFDIERVASVQTVAGTGANRIGAAFLSAHYATDSTKAYIGTPAWGNYIPLFTHAGIPCATYKYHDIKARGVDFASVLQAATQAPPGSIFVLQGCCNNPSGSDMTKEQWTALAQVIKERGHFAFFDVAYQGLGTTAPDGGLDDIWAMRHFVSQGINMSVCQSFSKNMGLYSERVGVLHIVCEDAAIASRVQDVLRSIVRWEFSSAPSYGARLAETILENPELKAQWVKEVAAASSRLVANRQKLHRELTVVLKTPGHWDFLLRDKGLFSLLGLSEEQVEMLISQHHIYLPANGRINVAGLNDSNIQTVARAIDSVIRKDL